MSELPMTNKTPYVLSPKGFQVKCSIYTMQRGETLQKSYY